MPSLRAKENLDKLVQYYKQGDWKRVLSMLDDNQPEEERFYDEIVLWIRPREDDLQFIGSELKKRNLRNLLSIGCGTGLLEWILLKCTGLNVTGLEVDRGWWENAYAPPTFIPLCYFNEQKEIHHLKGSDYALLFCYFNSKTAFEHYIDKFEGKCFIVIGPGTNNGKHTCPAPFELRCASDEWIFSISKQIGQTGDYIAFYDKKQKMSISDGEGII